MNAITKVRAASNAAATIIVIKGKGKAEREQAYLKIAPLSFVENMSRVETIANLRIALGATPTDKQMNAARSEWLIGRVASRLPAGELPKGTTDNADKLEFARDLVTLYAAPVKEGSKAKKLRAGQKGRRSVIQQRVVRAAEEAWSQVKAELGHGTAQTQKERNTKKTRAPQMAGSTARGGTPSHSALVSKPKPMTADEMHAHIVTQMTALLAFCNKNAKLIDTTFSMPIIACQKALLNADGERRTRKADAVGEKAEATK